MASYATAPPRNEAKRRGIFPSYSPGGATDHTVRRTTPVLSTPTGNA